MVTINARDFVRLARQEELHGGLVTFPSGSRPHEQLVLISRAIDLLETDQVLGRDPINRWLDISDDGEIRIRDLRAGTGPSAN